MTATGWIRWQTIVCWPLVIALAVLSPSSAQSQLIARIEAGALGGNVRAGPEISSKRVAKLKPGERVVLLENSGVVLNGYPWFKIEFRTGRTGHVWGGILCARLVAIAGLREQCEGFTLTTGSVTKIPVPTKMRMVHYQCSDGSHLIVRYESRGAKNSAVYSHDGYPEVSLAEVATEKGSAYSNGQDVLRSSGRRAVLHGGNKRTICAEP